MQKQKHSRKLAHTIKTECDTRAKNKDEDTFKHAQKEQFGSKKGGIPGELQYREQNE